MLEPSPDDSSGDLAEPPLRIMVTGASGFVGMNTLVGLAQSNHHVIAVSRSPIDHSIIERDVTKHRHLIQSRCANVTDPEVVDSLIREFQPTHIIHAAAVTPSNELERNFPKYIIDVNQLSTLNLLRASAEHGVTRFVFTSSAAVYKADWRSAVSEAAPIRINGGLYAITKVASECLCEWARNQLEMDTRVARIGPVYGPYERPTSSRARMSLVHESVRLASKAELLRCNDPEAIFNWIHGQDVATALRALLLSDDLHYHTYNVAGDPVIMSELLRLVVSHFPAAGISWAASIEEANLKVGGDRARMNLDTTRLRNDLCFHPAYPIDSGISQYIQWLSRVPESAHEGGLST